MFKALKNIPKACLSEIIVLLVARCVCGLSRVNVGKDSLVLSFKWKFSILYHHCVWVAAEVSEVEI